MAKDLPNGALAGRNGLTPWGWIDITSMRRELNGLIRDLEQDPEQRLVITRRDCKVATLIGVHDAALLQVVLDSPSLKAYIEELLQLKLNALTSE